ncbi:MAG TPA: DUF3750 domain-containing protein [Stellaceae bacterium]|nr:DUF3750 domain-containing protein [Stellaceae bacterium]
MSTGAIPRKRSGRVRRSLTLLLLLLVGLPLLVSACVFGRANGIPWYEARRDATGLAPDPAATHEAVIQVYAARAVAWRGIFAMHTWIAAKPTDAPRFTRYEVMGFGVADGAPALRIDRTGPDNYWFGAMPEVILDRRGPGVDALIEQIRAAVAAYPYPQSYRLWPGPNSNTFTAYIGRAVPELGLEMPSNAIGKDYLPNGTLVAAAPSGTGYQLSLFGLAGLLAARREGLELNLLGLTFGIDIASPAIKLPGIGRIGAPTREPSAQTAAF